MVTYFHSSIADYYLGIWGGGNPKPFKYTEIQRHRFNLQNKEGSADRKVPVQPLLFYSKEGTVTRYNLRKVSIKLQYIYIYITKIINFYSLGSYHITLYEHIVFKICTRMSYLIIDGCMQSYHHVLYKQY